MPLSLAGPTIDRDKTGTLCLVFEACISPSSVEKAKVDSGFLSWVAELCFEWLEEKHKIALEREFTLPKLKAKGKLSTHVVRQNIKPKILEMPKKAAVVDHKEPVTESVIPSISPVSAEPVIKASSKGRLPQYSIELNPISKPKEVIVTVKLLEAVSPSQSTLLQIESEKLFLLPNPNSAIPYPYDPLEVNIPVVFDVDGDVDAGFDRATRTLKVVLPIIA
ncbi:PIH1 family [Chytridium lagenaria]|nr:PIH1 family [Chytridium lagenaria]